MSFKFTNATPVPIEVTPSAMWGSSNAYPLTINPNDSGTWIAPSSTRYYGVYQVRIDYRESTNSASDTPRIINVPYGYLTQITFRPGPSYRIDMYVQ